jgi:hypothetical protein
MDRGGGFVRMLAGSRGFPAHHRPGHDDLVTVLDTLASMPSISGPLGRLTGEITATIEVGDR